MNIATLTSADMELLHKVTLYKYKKEESNILSKTEFGELPDYLKGYAVGVYGDKLIDIAPPSGNELYFKKEFMDGRAQAEREIRMMRKATT